MQQKIMYWTDIFLKYEYNGVEGEIMHEVAVWMFVQLVNRRHTSS